jgi:hypothetical protein
MVPLAIMAGVVGIVGFTASSTANILSLIDKTCGLLAAIKVHHKMRANFLLFGKASTTSSMTMISKKTKQFKMSFEAWRAPFVLPDPRLTNSWS